MQANRVMSKILIQFQETTWSWALTVNPLPPGGGARFTGNLTLNGLNILYKYHKTCPATVVKYN